MSDSASFGANITRCVTIIIISMCYGPYIVTHIAYCITGIVVCMLGLANARFVIPCSGGEGEIYIFNRNILLIAFRATIKYLRKTITKIKCFIPYVCYTIRDGDAY